MKLTRAAMLLWMAVACAVVARAGEDATNFKTGKPGQLAELTLPEPAQFKTADGRTGWKVKIPGGRPLATPALADGILFVGGGFGSHEFYALDAQTGKKVWTFQTGDDGPTAAVVAEGCVAYNTESCTLYVHEEKTGKLLWSKWLGDPLMSQPAIGDGRLFMAYPGQGGHHLVAFELKTGTVLWDKPIKAEIISARVLDGDACYAATCDGTLYHFAAADGKEVWSKQCNVTSAPVIVAGKVHFSQRALQTIEVAAADGKKTESQVTLEGYNSADPASGELAYKEPQNAIKAAYLLSMGNARAQLAANAGNSFGAQYQSRAVAKGVPALSTSDNESEALRERAAAYAKKPVSERPEDGIQDAQEAQKLAQDMSKLSEKIASNSKGNDDARKSADELKVVSEKLQKQAEATLASSQMAQSINASMKGKEREVAADKASDSSVAFATAPATAKLEASGGNIGQENVAGVWAYQGSRLLPYKDGFITVQGDRARCLVPNEAAVRWDTQVESKLAATRPASPPALAGGKLYLATIDGKVQCSDPSSGTVVWTADVGGSITFQPAVVGGRVYVASNDGTLICLETGDAKADGWTMWGGSAKHNGADAK